MSDKDYSKWRIWADYEEMKIVTQKEGVEPIYMTPDEARKEYKRMERKLETGKITADDATINYQESLLQYAEELSDMKAR